MLTIVNQISQTYKLLYFNLWGIKFKLIANWIEFNKCLLLKSFNVSKYRQDTL